MNYVQLQRPDRPRIEEGGSNRFNGETDGERGAENGMPFADYFELFTKLRQGRKVRDWAVENKNKLRNIDIRRFITFGVIRGFIYRVHRYPVLADLRSVQTSSLANGVVEGARHFDDICTERECSIPEAEQVLSAYGDIYSIYR